MPPHPAPVVAIRPRTLAQVLADLKEARRDYMDACSDPKPEAEDRATEAETRAEDLHEEAEFVFARSNGMPLAALLKCVEEGVL